MAGQRCLKSGADLQESTRPLLELIGEADPWDWLPDWCDDWAPSDYGSMHDKRFCNVCCIKRRGRRCGGGPLANTAAIAARCNVDLDLGTFHFPRVQVPAGETAYSLLAQRCFKGIARRYKPVSPEAMALLEKELRMIQQMDIRPLLPGGARHSQVGPLPGHRLLGTGERRQLHRLSRTGHNRLGPYPPPSAVRALSQPQPPRDARHRRGLLLLAPGRGDRPHLQDFWRTRTWLWWPTSTPRGPRSAVRLVAEALGFAPTEINALAANVPHHGDAGRIRDYLAGEWPELRDSPLQDGPTRHRGAPGRFPMPAPRRRKYAQLPSPPDPGPAGAWTPSPSTWARTWEASS